MNVMTYYWKKSIIDSKEDEIIARSYQISTGYILEVGKGYEDRNPVSNLRNFFVTHSTKCETLQELKREVKRFNNLYPNAEIYNTKETYH